MKILLVSDAYKYQTNGVANVVIALANGMRLAGHDVKVLAPSCEHRSFVDGDDYYIRSFSAFYYPDQRFCLVGHDRLLKELEAWKPDIVHMHTEGSVAHLGRKLASVLDVPIVMTSHTDYAQYAFGRFSHKKPVCVLTKLLGKFVYRDTEAVIVPSEKAVSFSQLASVKDHIVVIPNGIHLEQYQKQMTEDERKQLFSDLKLDDNGKIMVVVSRISKEKNIDEIISYLPYVLKRDPDVRLVVVGDGPHKEALELLSRRLNLAPYIRFVGFVKPEFVYKYYDMGNVFVSGSTFEVHSLTYLEAMSHGLPLVCRRDPCLKGVLDDGKNGFSYSTRDEFVDSVLSVLKNDEETSGMRSFALEKSSSFGVQAFVDNTIALYDRVLA